MNSLEYATDFEIVGRGSKSFYQIIYIQNSYYAIIKATRNLKRIPL